MLNNKEYALLDILTPERKNSQKLPKFDKNLHIQEAQQTQKENIQRIPQLDILESNCGDLRTNRES